MPTSPLRYPGGKAKLFPLFADLIKQNNLFGIEYCEPYAGGAGLAVQLLANGYASRIRINDIDSSIYAFWISVLHHTDKFCDLINRTPVNVREWQHQKEVWGKGDLSNLVQLGFAAYFLNRTNRSGIIGGAGPIGGYHQRGPWKIGVRFEKSAQMRNIRLIAKYSDQIEVTNYDALEFMQKTSTSPNTLIYLDPPYYLNGHRLYKNFYEAKDHSKIASQLRKRRSKKWVVSYDNVPEIRRMYASFSPFSYQLNYSAAEKTVGTELMFFSDALAPPRLSDFLVRYRTRT